jgi:pimeloyl-ACP methyl ester carboxylesterase
MSDSYLDLDGLKLRTLSIMPAGQQKGLPVAFFHGYSFSLDDWKRIGTLEYLSKKGHPVYAVDLPDGKTSRSDKIMRGDSRVFNEILEKAFKKLGLHGTKFFLVGPSMGGGCALSYALKNPSDIAGLVLISPSTQKFEETERLKVPVLLIWGERDNVYPIAEYGKPLKDKLPNSKLIILKGAGHAAYLDKTEEFDELIEDFFQEVSSD